MLRNKRYMINGKENNKMEHTIDDYCTYDNIYAIADSLKEATDLRNMRMILQNWLAINIISVIPFEIVCYVHIQNYLNACAQLGYDYWKNARESCKVIF